MMICGSDEAVSMLIRMCKRSRSNRALLVKKKLNDQMQLPEKKSLISKYQQREADSKTLLEKQDHTKLVCSL